MTTRARLPARHLDRRHPHRPRRQPIIIIDDPMKPADAQSDARRLACQQWFSNTLLSRLDDKVNGAIVLVMQRFTSTTSPATSWSRGAGRCCRCRRSPRRRRGGALSGPATSITVGWAISCIPNASRSQCLRG